MAGFRRLAIAAAFAGLFAFGCGGAAHSSGASVAQNELTGSAFGQPFVPADTLLVHPQSWKSAAAGSTAILVSDTTNLCAQITAGKTTAPGRLVVVSLQRNGADGKVVDLDVGQYAKDGQGTPSSRYGELFLSGVDAQCAFEKSSASDRSSIHVTSVGPGSTQVSVTVDVHFASGDELQGSISASTGCDEAAVDQYLNSSAKCG